MSGLSRIALKPIRAHSSPGISPSMMRVQVSANRLRWPGELHLFVPNVENEGLVGRILKQGFEAFREESRGERIEVLQALPRNAVFIDVGAHVGIFAFDLARWRPDIRVFAFEPHPVLSRCLKATRAENIIDQVVVQPCALGSFDGEADLYVDREKWEAHTLYESRLSERNGLQVEKVQVQRLDTWMLSVGGELARTLGRVDVIKLDAPGGEWDVLEGARRTIQAHRPAILVEFDTRSLLSIGSQRLEAFFRSLGAGTYGIRRCGDPCALDFAQTEFLAAMEWRKGRLRSSFWLEDRARSVV